MGRAVKLAYRTRDRVRARRRAGKVRHGLLAIGPASIGDPVILGPGSAAPRASRCRPVADVVRLALARRRRLVSIGAFVRGTPSIKHYGGRAARAVIGPYASIGAGAELFVDGDHRPDWITTYPLTDLHEPGMGRHLTNKGDVVVGPGAWIGAEALLLSGVHVGPGAVVAPRAVVTRDVEPYTVVAGNPARSRGRRFEGAGAAELADAEWWTWPHADVLAHPLALAPPAGTGFDTGGVLAVTRDMAHGRLPARYESELREPAFSDAVRRALAPGMTVLDVGAGTAPSSGAGERPAGCTWVGQDVVAAELRKAPAGSYDELSVGSICDRDPVLEGRFDLVLARFVFEHVTPLGDAIENLRTYLRPGGRLIALLSGRWSAFALLNRVLPAPLARLAMARTLGRDPDTVFEAHYDGCTKRGLERMLAGWGSAAVQPHFCGVGYFTWSRPLMAGYVAFEEIAVRRGWDDLATYYLVEAERGWAR
jgi:acetyltransferase-like isoleucine patch superfamily enzyme/SAM-dependent methyltransferase